jgi:hypothetical protein
VLGVATSGSSGCAHGVWSQSGPKIAGRTPASQRLAGVRLRPLQLVSVVGVSMTDYAPCVGRAVLEHKFSVEF